MRIPAMRAQDIRLTTMYVLIMYVVVDRHEFELCVFDLYVFEQCWF